MLKILEPLKVLGSVSAAVCSTAAYMFYPPYNKHNDVRKSEQGRDFGE